MQFKYFPIMNNQIETNLKMQILSKFSSLDKEEYPEVRGGRWLDYNKYN